MQRFDEDDDGLDEEVPVKSITGYVLTREQDAIYKVFEKFLPKLQARIDLLEQATAKGKRVSTDYEAQVRRIQTDLLPKLPRKLCRMCDLLFSPVYYHRLEAPQFEDGMALLIEVEEIVEQIGGAMKLFWTADLTQSSPTYDRDIRRYRCLRSQSKILELFKDLEELLYLYFSLIPLSEIRLLMRKSAKVAWGQIIQNTLVTGQTIDKLISWFSLSDLGMIQEQWQEMAEEMEDLLEELVEFPTINRGTLTQPLLQFVPVLKLSRLFFNKLSKPTNSEAHPISQMSPSYLLHLLDATLPLPNEIKHHFYDIEYQREPVRFVDSRLVCHLITLFQIPLNILNDYLALQGANPNSPHLLHEKYLFWYAAWQCQFFLAVRHFQVTYREVYAGFLAHP